MSGRTLTLRELNRATLARQMLLEQETVSAHDAVPEVQPEGDPDALAYAVRNNLPLVQVTPGGAWGSGSRAAYTIASVSGGAGGLLTLLLRCLAAFGPATVMDFQTWSGMVRLKPAVEDIKPELRVLRDEEGRELLDVPDAPLPETPAPPRFLPEYDNLLLSHADWSRVISGGNRKKVFLSAGRVRATFLVDGFVAGTWRTENQRGVATLVAEPFAPLPQEARDLLISEAVRLVRFSEEAEAFEVRVEEP